MSHIEGRHERHLALLRSAARSAEQHVVGVAFLRLRLESSDPDHTWPEVSLLDHGRYGERTMAGSSARAHCDA